jgi:hypothetical protein
MKKKTTEEIVISESCFRQQVNLPLTQVAGLSDTEIASALAFEIEPFSGISRAEGEMAWRLKSDASSNRRIYDVIQIRKSDLARVVARAKSEKKKIKGITASPDFSAGETLEEMPFVEISKKKIRLSPMTIWLAFCGVFFIALLGEWAIINSENKRLKQEIGEREILQVRKNSLEAKERSIRNEIENIKAMRAEEISSQDKVASLRSSWRILLDAVSSACGDESVICSISKKDGPLKASLEGVALSPEAASLMLRRLTEKLNSQKSKWHVLPGEIGSVSSGGTVKFTCDVIFEMGR